MIEEYQKKHSKGIWEIYSHYVLESNATLDHEVPDFKEFSNYCLQVSKDYVFLVYIKNEEVIAYAYADKWKRKEGYKNTLESTIYVSPDNVNKGVGSQLYTLLILRLRKMGIRNLVACLTLPNTKSVALHERMGFIKAGHFNSIAKKFGQTVDVGYWQLIL